jgi:hypothetical protein
MLFQMFSEGSLFRAERSGVERMVDPFLSPRPRPLGRVERSAFKVDSSASVHQRCAFGRNDIGLPYWHLVSFTYNLDVQPTSQDCMFFELTAMRQTPIIHIRINRNAEV